MKKHFILNENELEKLIKELPKSGVIILQGDLASGKTTLCKQIANFLGKSAQLTSPTFALMQDYGELYHYDLYRTNNAQIMANGLFENFFEDGLHLVEWGDDELIKMLLKYEISVFVVKIAPVSGDKRSYELDLSNAH